MTCPVCGASEVTLAEVDHAFIRETDYTTVKDSCRIGECGVCWALFQCVDAADVAVIDEQFEDEAYGNSQQTGQTVMVEQFGGPVTRSFLQAEVLRPLIANQRPAVLDVGCFDGKLLVELSARFAEADLHGFDRNAFLRRLFPTKPNFHFWTGDLATVDGRFDLICLSHSMSYVRDTTGLMNHTSRLLKPEGLVFLQMPDIAQNPCYLLMADQFYYYTPDILRNLFGRFGFEFSPLDNAWFPREIVGFARLLGRNTLPSRRAYGLAECLAALEEKARRCRDIAATVDKAAVLGTTGNAAFVDSVLGERVSRFLEENPNRRDGSFRGKPVNHPRVLCDTDVVMVPYGPAGHRLGRRLAAQYRGRFIVV